MATRSVTDTLAYVRDALDEQTASQWTNSQLKRWINDGLNDLARRTHHLEDRRTFVTVAGTSEYTAATDILTIKTLYWVTSDGRYKPLAAMHYESADMVWGQWQNQEAGEPTHFTTWGHQPALKIRLYTVPSSINTISMMCARLPAQITVNDNATDATTVDWVQGWDDQLTYYVEFRALRKDRDQRWQEAKSLYEESLQDMIGRDYLYESRLIVPDPAVIGGVPWWIAQGR